MVAERRIERSLSPCPGDASPDFLLRRSVGHLGRKSDTKAELLPLAAKVWCYCEDRGIFGKTVTVTVTVKYADFQVITRSRTIHDPVCGEEELLAFATGLLEATFPAPKGIRLLGITLSSLDASGASENGQQLSFSL